jgi:predicted membrane protein
MTILYALPAHAYNYDLNFSEGITAALVTIGALILFFAILFILAMSVLWLVLPLAIFGIKPLLKKIIAQNDAMMKMQMSLLPKPDITDYQVEEVKPEDIEELSD